MTSREPYPNLEPDRVEPAPAESPTPLAEAQDRQQRRWDRTRAVRMSCTIVKVVCGLFAVVLVAHIIMVMGEANPANGVASFVRGFAGAVWTPGLGLIVRDDVDGEYHSRDRQNSSVSPSVPHDRAGLVNAAGRFRVARWTRAPPA